MSHSDSYDSHENKWLHMTCTRVRVCVNESCRTCEWVISQTWHSHIAHVNESCHTYEWVMSHMWKRRVAHVTESCRIYAYRSIHVKRTRVRVLIFCNGWMPLLISSDISRTRAFVISPPPLQYVDTSFTDTWIHTHNIIYITYTQSNLYTCVYGSMYVCMCVCVRMCIYIHGCIHTIWSRYMDTHTHGVPTLSRLLKMTVAFAKYSLFYRALLQKRPIILRSLLIEASP